MSDPGRLPPDPETIVNRPPIARRTRLQDIPEIANLRIALIDNGFGELVRVADAHLEIDTAGMKRTAVDLYGRSKDRILGKGALSTALEETGHHAYESMIDSVGDEWEGDAYEAFKRFSEQLKAATIKEADRLRVIGDALHSVAEALEQGQEELEMTYLGAAGLLLTTKGLFNLGRTPPTLILGLVEALLSVLDHVEERAQVAAENAKAQKDARIEITRPKVMTSGPKEALRDFAYPKDPDTWQIEED